MDGSEDVTGNYDLTTKTPGTLKIVKATMTVEAVDYEGVYDGADHEGGATPSVTTGTTVQYRVKDGDSWSDWTDTVPSIKNVGTVEYEVKATNPNYEDATDGGTLKVTKKEVTVKVENAPDVTYDSEEHTGETEYAFTGIVEGQTATITYTPAKGTDVATCKTTC